MSNVGWAFNVCKEHGVDTKGMSVNEVINKANELQRNGEKSQMAELRTQERKEYALAKGSKPKLDGYSQTNQDDNVNSQEKKHPELHHKLTDKKWENSLSNKQKEAIRSYTSYSGNINRLLEEDEALPKEMQERCDLLDSAIDSYELKEPITVYRCVSPKEQKSGVFKNKKFLSSHIDKEVAIERANRKVIYEIDLPAERGLGAYINNFSSYKNNEYEFLLGRGLSFEEVDRREENGIQSIKWRVV